MGVIMKNSVEYGVNGGVTDVMLNNNSIVEGGIASIPLVSSSTDGAVPAGATVSTQDQTTKFLREDGSWAVPSYTTKTDKANVDGSNITNPAAFRSAIEVDDIGSFWSLDWTATSSSAINIILTEQKTLAKGVYIAIGTAPTVSVNDYAVAIRASKTINAKTVYNIISTLSSLAFTFEVLTDDTNVYISSASSTSVTFSNLTNGGLRIVKIK